MKNKIILVVLLLGLAWVWWNNNQQSGDYDAFAQCIAEAGAKEYGAFWCSYCKRQKKMFGNSFKHVNYIECSNPDKSQNQVCNEAGIESYPTWEFEGGSRVNGVMSFEELSEKTGCSLE